jgi:hypothetical protein
MLDQGGSPGVPAPPAAPAAETDDDLEPVSKADLARMRVEIAKEAEEKAAKRAEQLAEEKVKAVLNAAVTERQAGVFKQDFDTTIDGYKASFPELKFIEGVDEQILAAGQRAFLAQIQLNGPNVPVDVRLVKQAMQEDAERRALKLRAHVKELEKTAAVEQATLTTGGIEPPGGNAPPTQAPKKKLSLKDAELDAQVTQDILSIMGRG